MTIDELNSEPDAHNGLFEPGTANAPVAYLRRIWKLRHYVGAEARGTVESRYANTTLGNLWLYIEPLLDMFVWFMIFGVGIRADREIPGEDIDFMSYLAVGITAYGLMRVMFNNATWAIRDTRAIPFDFPRGITVISRYARILYEYRFRLVIMFLVVMARGYTPRFSWLLLVPLTVLSLSFAAGIGFCLARIGVTKPSVTRIVEKLLQFTYWMAGVIIPIEGYILRAENGEELLRWYTLLNPFYIIVKLHQWAVIGYEPPQMWVGLWMVPLWLTVPLIGGFVWMVRGEGLYRVSGSRRD